MKTKGKGSKGMVITWLRALLFAAGVVVAGGGTAYFTGLLDPWLEAPAAVAVSPVEEAAPEKPKERETEQAAVQPEGSLADGGKQPRLIAPTFDVLRVEPDGSIVIAGQAAPNAHVEIVAGDTVLGKATAGTAGDFATALDKRLEPGDYQIVLRSTTPENVVATSTETAVVAIPQSRDGQVLALVEQPGEPSKLITVPEAGSSEGQTQVAQAPAGDVAQKPQETAPDAPATDLSELAAEKPTQPPAEPQIAQAPANEPQPAGEDSGTAAAPLTDEPASATADGSAGNGTATAPEPDASTEAEPAQPTGPMVVVEAVEIEGDNIFVAGMAEPGRTVRVYANELLLGDARASPSGRFLVEASRELPVGDYIIRADLLNDDGTVVARAAVPFEREPGEAIAAVAPGIAEAQSSNQVASGAPEPAGQETADASPADAPAAAEEKQEVAAATPETSTAQPGETNLAADEAQIAALAEREPAGETGQPADMAAAPETGQSGAAAMPAAPEGGGAAAVAATTRSEATVGDDVANAVAAAPSAADEPAELAAASQSEAAAAQVGEGSVPTVTAPKLQSVKSAVIIRRGDTLWQISRRVYGRGVRYSTIYLANTDQIEDPDWIWPGQVFDVPTVTEEGEAADMDAIGDQAVTPEEGPIPMARQ